MGSVSLSSCRCCMCMSCVHPVAVLNIAFCMCVLYVSFGAKVRPRTFGCVAIGSALLCIVRSRLLVYSARSDVKTEWKLFCLDLV